MNVPRAPFPWFGGKSRVADVVWRAFGNVPNYVEPFAGSLAVLLGRPHEPKIETVNDLDCYLANFWRAVQADPEGVAAYADWPVNEADLHARHKWLVGQAEFRERMNVDPDHFDVKIAGWWVWGLCCWIGDGWCRVRRDGHPSEQIPHLGDAGMGIHRKIPHLGDAGMGRIPSLGHSGRGIHSPCTDDLRALFSDLAERLRRVRVACGDWGRVVTNAVTGVGNRAENMGMLPCGVFLDPPYDDGRIDYAVADSPWGAAARWAEENGGSPALRIALCGYDGQPAPKGWTEHAWKAHGGYGSQADGDGRANSKRERIWFSPHCLPLDAVQPSLFDRVPA